jgi:3-ketoacyl-CoA synthase
LLPAQGVLPRTVRHVPGAHAPDVVPGGRGERELRDPAAGAIGLGEETCVPVAYHYMPPDRSLMASRDETELVIFSTVDDAFARSGVKPEEIDMLIINCSIFTPTPVFSDMIVNRYKLHANMQNVNLSGMGCSAGLVSVGLARNLLQVAPHGTNVLIVSTEILSLQYYVGTERAMLLPNCLFRMGAASMILCNSPERARFKLKRIVRMVTAAPDTDYRCVFQEEDDQGITGIRLSKDLATTATCGPLVLPVSEQILVMVSVLKRQLLSGHAKVRLYRLDFCTTFEDFCIHASGHGVTDEVQQGLGISDGDVEASRMNCILYAEAAIYSPFGVHFHLISSLTAGFSEMFLSIDHSSMN